jgi:Na+-translocating ferredoxin:NAD+ oxidoreductase RnfG subunit
MMGFTWYILGVLTGAAAIFLWKFSKQYRLDRFAWSGLVLGMVLILFTIAWCVGAVLEGVPRAASMGLLLFGLSGIVLLSFTYKYINARLEKVVADQTDLKPVDEKVSPEKAPKHLTQEGPALKGVIGQGARYLAYISLVIAFFVGMVSESKDYEAMLTAKYQDQKLTRVNDDPVVFELGEKEDGVGNYVVIAEGQGYGGPFVIGVRIMDDAMIHEVMLLDNRETPAFRQKVEEANFPGQFVGKHVADNFIPDDDIDAVSGATISTMAGTEAIRKAAHIAATKYFKLAPTWEKEPWKFGPGEVLILIIFVLAFFPKIYAKKPWSYVYLAATIGIVGFYLNAAISIGSLSGLVMGFIPGIKTHLIWWTLVVGTVLVILINGKNIYCFRICPFYGIEYLLGKISGSRLKLPPAFLGRTKFISNFLLWLSLMAIFLSSHPALGSFEPFAMMFSLNGVGIQWFILPLALIGSFFMSSFWCRFFCPCGNALTNLVQFRKKTINLFIKG